MKITLDLVRQLLRENFGRESFIASFISSIRETKDIPTACITREGLLQYNPEFTKEHVNSPEDLFCIIVHEMLHPMFGHFVHGTGQLENIAADTVINAAISRVYAESSGGGRLFRSFYAPQGLEGLLRPDSEMTGSRYAALYESFYSQYAGRAKLSTGEVIQTLRVLTPLNETMRVVLLGSHGVNGHGSGPNLPTQARARIAEDLKRAIKNGNGKLAGFGLALHDLLVEVLDSHLSFRRALLEKFETQRKVDKFKHATSVRAMSFSPVPLSPSKRDLVLLGADMPQLHYHNRVTRPREQTRGLAIYLDVSGSVSQHLPQIIGLLREFERELITVFLFSNKVVEVPFRQLLKGQVATTGGTDFNCIAGSIIENELDRAVILTDGYATLKPECAESLRENRVQTLTVLFGGKKDCPEFAPFGDVVQLTDITH